MLSHAGAGVAYRFAQASHKGGGFWPYAMFMRPYAAYETYEKIAQVPFPSPPHNVLPIPQEDRTRMTRIAGINADFETIFQKEQ